MTISNIRKAVRASGSHWFDESSMAFFGTILKPHVYEGIGGIFFITSEQPPYGVRCYSVRQYNPITHNIHTVGDFCVMNEYQAKRLARRMAANSPKSLCSNEL